MRHHKQLAGLAVIGLALVGGLALFVPAEEPAGGKINIFFLQGGGHDWKAHFPILEALLTKSGDFTVTMSEDLNELKADSIKKYDVVLFYGSGLDFKDAEQEKGLCDFVRGGHAFVGVHSASDSFKKSDAYWELVGGRFAGHGGAKFTVYIHDTEHPITAGLAEFEIQDETYSHQYHKNQCMRSLVRMNQGDERQSMGWVQTYGKGRVFYTSLGHGREAWTNPQFQRLVVRGIYWSVGRKPKDPPA
jgi:type 1 glutamine amidotransferase